MILKAVRERIAADGGDPLPSSPEQYAADIGREEAKWSVLIRKLSLKVEWPRGGSVRTSA